MSEPIFTAINPAEWKAPRGYNNGMLAQTGAMLFIAGQIGWDAQQQIVSDQFSNQFEQALVNVLTVVQAAGGEAQHVGKLTIYVTSKQQYLAQIKEIGAAYRRLFGKHFPAMALIEVAALLEDRALVEIEAIAVIPSHQ